MQSKAEADIGWKPKPEKTTTNHKRLNKMMQEHFNNTSQDEMIYPKDFEYTISMVKRLLRRNLKTDNDLSLFLRFLFQLQDIIRRHGGKAEINTIELSDYCDTYLLNTFPLRAVVQVDYQRNKIQVMWFTPYQLKTIGKRTSFP